MIWAMAADSGHTGSRLVEDSLAIDLAWLMRLAPIRVGQAGSGEIEWSRDGVALGTLHFRLDLRAIETSQLVLNYSVAMSDGETKRVRQTIALTSLPQHLGGRRWWIRCPVTREKIRILYFPPSGDHFAGRKALGLAYRVERLNRFDRPFEKLFRAQRRLGSEQGLGAGLEKPRGMWRRTYARHAERVASLDLDCAEKIAALIKRA